MANELPAKSFSFTALTASRQTLAGARLAADEDDLAAMLRAEGLVPLRIARSGGKSGWRGVMMTDLSFGPAVNAKDMAGIIFELGSLLSAGITLDESLSVIAEGRTKPRQSSFIRSVHEAIKSGASLHMALSQHPKEVADYVIGIIKAGEASGSLGPTLVRLATDLQEQQSSIAEFRKALVYPIILAVTALIVIFVLFVVVVPQLEGLFSEQARHALPLVAQAVLSISAFIRDTWLILLALFVLGTAGLIGASRSKMARGPLDRMRLRLPLLGPVLRSQGLARYLRVLASLLQGGVPVERALELSARTQPNQVMRTQLLGMHRSLVEGRSLSAVAGQTGLFGAETLSMFRAGERSGQLRLMVERAATLTGDRAKKRLEVFVTLAGPLLTAGLGVIAGTVAYAVLSTLLSVNELALQ
jgi:general secretion pathway protein F